MAAGRPREFDMEKALDKALHVFWEKGYEGASMPDLTKAMNINRPSLYAAFGNKEELFRKALDRYIEKSASCLEEALNQPTARASVEELLKISIENNTNPKNPQGCLIVKNALSCGGETKSLRKDLVSRCDIMFQTLKKRFDRAKKEGDLPKNANSENLARFVSTIIQGITVQASNGANRKELQSVVDTALLAFPE